MKRYVYKSNKLTLQEFLCEQIKKLENGKEELRTDLETHKEKLVTDLETHKEQLVTDIETHKEQLVTDIETHKEQLVTDLDIYKEEVLNITNDFINTTNKDLYENSKIDFYGNEHKTLDSRLNADFDNVHQRINESELIPYEGTQIKADNSYYGLQKDTVVKGRTLQNLVDGKNMFIDSSNNTTRTIQLQANLLKINTIYTFIFNVKRNTLTRPLRTLTFEGEFLPANKTFVEVGQTGIVKTVVTTTDTIKPAIGISTDSISGIDSGTQIIEFDIMVLEGDHTNTPLEELPFIEGIESVGDKSKNLFDGQMEDGTFTDTGGLLPHTVYIRSVNFIKAKPNTQYALSFKNNDRRMSVCEYDTNQKFIKILYDKNAEFFTTSENTQYLKLRVEKSSTYIQVEEGTQATPYEPYYDGYKISGKSIGKNIFEAKNKNTFNSKGVTIEYIGGNSYRINGTATEQITYPINTVDGSVKDNLLFKAGKRYIISDGGNSSKTTAFIQLAVINTVTGEKIFPTTAQGVLVLSKEQDCIGRIVFVIRSGVKLDNVIMNVQIEEGRTATPYEPYKETTYSYILNEPLRSLPNGVCDEIDLTSGVLTRRVGKVVLDGSENWYAWTNIQIIQDTHVAFTLGHDFIGTNYKDSNENNLLCNNFMISDNPSTINNSKPYRLCALNTHELYALQFKIEKTALVSADCNGFKQWLQANPTTVYYQLSEPTTEQLTPQQLKSFDTTTHIISDNKLMPVISTKIHSNVQAIISTLKLENSDLKNNVETLSIENENLKETVNNQNNLIDTSLCATDELYCMIENLLPEVIE